jgi:hypothetical protein
MTKRIGKVIPRSIQSNTTNTNTIHITNVLGEHPTPGIDPLCSLPVVESHELPDIPESNEEFDVNPKLCKFKVKRMDEQEYVIDVEFLVHVIKVLVENHNITITPADVEEMLSQFGDVSVKTQQQTYTTRDVEPTCCGMSSKQQEHVMSVIKSVALNGMNLAKHLPEMLTFLTKIGVPIL